MDARRLPSPQSLLYHTNVGTVYYREWCVVVSDSPNVSDTPKATDHYGVPQYFRRAYHDITKQMMSDAYRADNKGGKQALAIDLFNVLFAHAAGAMENGVGYIRSVGNHWRWDIAS
jgi:hypothetical protein